MTAAALCLAVNLFWEARSSASLTEWYAIAWVVQNRVEAPQYPDTVCAVIRQPHQFSWTAHHWKPVIDGEPDRRAWVRIKRFAAWFVQAVNAGVAVDPTDGALHYASGKAPWWAVGMQVAAVEGGHVF
ncbi:cell wall hydrolase, partial [Photobacterium sanguinicancri]